MNYRFLQFLLEKKISNFFNRSIHRSTSASKILFKKEPDKVEFIGRYGFAWKLMFDDTVIKCYRVSSQEQFLKVKKATSILQENGVLIPDIVGFHENLVFAEWVEGEPLAKLIGDNPTYVRKMAQYQAALHSIEATVPNLVFEQWGMIKNRILKLVSIRYDRTPYAEISAVISALEARFAEMSGGLSATVVNPGGTPDNIVVDKHNNLVLIDNEILSCGYGREYDLLYTIKHLDKLYGIKEDEYLGYYSEFCSLEIFETYRYLWEAFDMMRVIGKRLTFYNADLKACYDAILTLQGNMNG